MASPTVQVRVNAARGASGLSAYQVWLAEGNTGSVDDFFNWIVNQYDLTVTSATGQAVNSRALLAAIAGPVDGQLALLLEPGREGEFVFDDSDLSAAVTADPLQAFYVPPSSDTDGSSGAWVRRWHGEANGKWWGAAGDGTTDDTAAVQAAVDWAIDQGVAKIVYPPGIYQVTNITYEGYSTYNNPAGGVKVIEIAGSAPPPFWYGSIGEFNLSEKGTIFRCPGGTTGSMFRALPFDVPGTYDFSWYNLVFRNLLFRTYDNPNINVIDAEWAQHLIVRDVMIDTGVYGVQASEPTNDVTAIITPKTGNAAMNILENIAVTGYYRAYKFGEHTWGNYLNVHCCKWALWLEQAYHPSRVGRICIQRCQYGIAWNAAHPIDVEQLAYEDLNPAYVDPWNSNYTVDNAWQATVEHLRDITNVARASVRYKITQGGTGTEQALVMNGGMGIRTAPVGQAMSQAMGQFSISANVAVANNTTHFITFTSEDVKKGVRLQSGQPTRAEVVTPGRYRAVLQLTFAGNATGVRAGIIYVGATAVAKVEVPPTGAASTTSIAVTLASRYLNANDYFRFAAFQTSGGSLNIIGDGVMSAIATVTRIADL